MILICKSKRRNGVAFDATPIRCNHCCFNCLFKPFPHPHPHRRYILEMPALLICRFSSRRTHQRFDLCQRFVQHHRPQMCLVCCLNPLAATPAINSWLLSILAEGCSDGRGVLPCQQPNRSIDRSGKFWPKSNIVRTTDRWWHSTPKPRHPSTADGLLCICIDDASRWGPEAAAIAWNHHRSHRWFFAAQPSPWLSCTASGNRWEFEAQTIRIDGGAIEEEIRMVWGVLERWLVLTLLRLQWRWKNEVGNMGWVPCFKMELLSFYTELEAHQHTIRKLKSTALSW